MTAALRVVDWRSYADSLAEGAVAIRRQPQERPKARLRGAPVQPEPVFFGIVVGQIEKQERVSRRKAGRLLAEHLINSPKLTDADRALLGVPKPGSTEIQIASLADRLRKG